MSYLRMLNVWNRIVQLMILSYIYVKTMRVRIRIPVTRTMVHKMTRIGGENIIVVSNRKDLPYAVSRINEQAISLLVRRCATHVRPVGILFHNPLSNRTESINSCRVTGINMLCCSRAKCVVLQATHQ
jgi:hypothetical protein